MGISGPKDNPYKLPDCIVRIKYLTSKGSATVYRALRTLVRAATAMCDQAPFNECWLRVIISGDNNMCSHFTDLLYFDS